jgi:hypothetical protein
MMINRLPAHGASFFHPGKLANRARNSQSSRIFGNRL